MRQLTASLFIGSVLFAAGCNTWMHRGGGTVADNTPTGEQIPTTAKELVEYLNICSSRLNSVKTDLDMDCRANGQSVGLAAGMVCEKPRNLRLRGKLAGQAACDIGSNNEEFWYWIKQDDQPLYHCSYDAMARGNVPLPFPFQPDMVMAALGMAEYNPDPNRYEVKVLAKTVELSEESISAAGKPIRKVTVFARGRVDQNDIVKGRPQVIEYKIRDAQGKDLCKATVERVRYERGAIVPQKLRLSWPAERMELALTLRSVEVNSVDAQRNADLFRREGLPYKSFDLARGVPDAGSTSIQRTRGSMR
jgi:hypothetical protein